MPGRLSVRPKWVLSKKFPAATVIFLSSVRKDRGVQPDRIDSALRAATKVLTGYGGVFCLEIGLRTHQNQCVCT